MPMKILISNDDGYQAPGIVALHAALKDIAEVEVIAPEPFVRYCALCGWVLARAHARTGDAAAICGYLGSGTVFDEAIVSFALDYAAVTEADHARLVDAIARGDVHAEDG